jgi:hypothetical protein
MKNDKSGLEEELYKQNGIAFWEIVGGGEIDSIAEKEIFHNINKIKEQATEEYVRIPKLKEEEIKFANKAKVLTVLVLIGLITIVILFLFTGSRLKLILYNETQNKVQVEIKESSNKILKIYFIDKKAAYSMIIDERDNMKKYKKIMNDYFKLSAFFKGNKELKNNAMYVLNDINEFEKLFLDNIEKAIKNNDINGLVLASTYKNIMKEKTEKQEVKNNNLDIEKTDVEMVYEKPEESELKKEYKEKIESTQIEEMYGVNVYKSATEEPEAKRKRIETNREVINREKTNTEIDDEKNVNIKKNSNGIEEESF